MNDNPDKKSSLFVGHFGKLGNIPPPGDPITVTAMMVDVDRIAFFEGNPRHAPNERFDEIKESIRAKGLDNALPISRRPTDPLGHYIIYKGGNTRLRILKELWEETKDPQFLKVRCEFHPFVSDTDALIAHLRENDLRGGMTFIDKAVAIREAKTMLETELGETLSLRKLETALKERGFPISNSMIAKLEYAASLNAVLPMALQAGLGKPQIERLAKLERAIREVWRFHGDADGSEQHFRETVFLPALSATDDNLWSYEAAESVLLDKLLAVLPPATGAEMVTANFRRALEGEPLELPAPIAASNSSGEPAEVSPHISRQEARIQLPSGSGTVASSADNSLTMEIGVGTDEGDGIDPDLAADPVFGGSPGFGSPTTATATGTRDVIIDGNSRWLEKLRALRERNHELAVKLADCIPNGSRSITQLNLGHGFIVHDVFNESYITSLFTHLNGPDADTFPLAERQQADDAVAHAACMWWFLVEVSATFTDQASPQNSCPEEVLAQYVPPDSYIHTPEVLHKFHPVIHHPERLRIWWLKLPDARRKLVFELIDNVVAVNDLMLAHAHETGGANAWEVST